MGAEINLLQLPSSQPLSRSEGQFLKFNTRPNLRFPSNPLRKSSQYSPGIKAATLTGPLSVSDQLRVKILSHSLGYIDDLRGKTAVVKYGGAAMKCDSVQSLVRDLILLSRVGLRLVLVQGDSPDIDAELSQKPPELHQCIFSSKASILAARICHAGGFAISLDGPKHLSAMPAGAQPSLDATHLGFPPEMWAELTILEPGNLDRVDPTRVEKHLSVGIIPVVVPIAWEGPRPRYRVNADSVAGELAAALGAEKLILMTDAAGISADCPVKEIDIKGAKKMIQEGKVADEMIPTVNCCIQSLAQGVRTASIIDGRINHSLLHELMMDDGAGTLIHG